MRQLFWRLTAEQGIEKLSRASVHIPLLRHTIGRPTTGTQHTQ